MLQFNVRESFKKNRKNKIVHDLHTKQRFVTSIGNIEKACEFSNVWTDQAIFGSTEISEVIS